MELYIFTSITCTKCPAIKKKITRFAKKLNIKLSVVNVDHWEMKAIAAYHDVMTLPTILAVDENEVELKRWCDVVPNVSELKYFLK